MKKIIALLIFFFNIFIAFSQSLNVDSMIPKIPFIKSDSARVRVLWDCLGTSETDPVLDMTIAGKLLGQAQKNNDPVEEVISLSCLGYDYRAFGDNTKSLKYDLQADSVAEQNPNEESKALADLGLAFNYEDMGDYNHSRKRFLSAINYASKTKFDKVLSLCYTYLGEYYLNLDKIDSALMYTQRGYELSMKIGYRDYMGPLLQQLGTIHAKLGNPTLAISYYNLAVQEGYKMKSPKFISSSYTALAQYFYTTHQVDSALVYAKKAIAVVHHTAFSNMGIYPAKLLLDIYRNTNIDSAFKYSEIYRIANDSLFNAKTIQQTQLLAFEETVHQQQLAEEKIKTDEKQRENIQYALIALGIITFIMLFLLLSRSFITNTKLIEFFGVVALLIVFEFLNLLLHPYLDRITKHTPLLLLLALVIIAAILVPLHHRLEKWTTTRLVEKNKQIRLAAAKKTIEKLENKKPES